MRKTAVVLLNLGAPDSTAAMRPFLFNLFNDPAIITLPQPLRRVLAALIARRRTPVAQAIYERLGGGSRPARACDAVVPNPRKQEPLPAAKGSEMIGYA